MRYVVFFVLAFVALSGKPLELEVSARSALLMNAETGAVLYEKNAHTPAYPASLTKVATALYLLERKGVEGPAEVVVAEECLRYLSPEDAKEAYLLDPRGTTMGLKKGERVSLDALLHGLLLASGNDAANVLAYAAAPTIPHFMEEMNTYLKEIGCQNTHFLNPHGLHHEGHTSTAFDLAWIAKRAIALPRFREIVSKVSYWKPKTNKQPSVELKQTNPLLKPGAHFYQKACGIKTGYTAAAGYSFIGAAEHEGRTLIAVVLGCPERKSRYQDAIRLFETAFQQEPKTESYFHEHHLFSREVIGGSRPLQARLKRPLSLSFYPAEEPVCRGLIQWDPVSLPIGKGQCVGRVEIVDHRGEVLSAEPLFSEEEVQETFWHRITNWIRKESPTP